MGGDGYTCHGMQWQAEKPPKVPSLLLLPVVAKKKKKHAARQETFALSSFREVMHVQVERCAPACGIFRDGDSNAPTV